VYTADKQWAERQATLSVVVDCHVLSCLLWSLQMLRWIHSWCDVVSRCCRVRMSHLHWLNVSDHICVSKCIIVYMARLASQCLSVSHRRTRTCSARRGQLDMPWFQLTTYRERSFIRDAAATW